MAKRSVKTHELSARRMPGFTAEASLYTSPTNFRQIVAQGGFGSSALVAPQLSQFHCLPNGLCCYFDCPPPTCFTVHTRFGSGKVCLPPPPCTSSCFSSFIGDDDPLVTVS